MSHGWRGLVCRSACKPHFHLPIFTFLDTQRALFFLVLTVVQQVVSCKLCLQNWGIALWNSYCGEKASKIETQKEKTSIKQLSCFSYSDTVRASYCMRNRLALKFSSLREENSQFCSDHFFPILHYTRTLVHGAFCILHYVRGLGGNLGSAVNFTGLRNSRFAGNTDHLAQAWGCPEVGEHSPDLLTTSLGPLNRWDRQGECGVPEGGFAVIDQWKGDSALPVCCCEFTCVCSFSVLIHTVPVCASMCVKRVLPVWKASPALGSSGIQPSRSKPIWTVP